MPQSREERLKKTPSISHFLPHYLSLRWGWGYENVIVSLPYRCDIPNLVKIGPIVPKKKFLTQDGRRRTDGDGGQLIAIDYLSDSGDLKIQQQVLA